jgi:hypothetical protein
VADRCALRDGGEHRDDCLYATAKEVRDLRSGKRRHVAHPAARQHPARGEVPDVVPRAIAQRTGLAESAQRADDEARRLGDERFRCAAEPREHPRAESFDEHVGARAQTAQHRGATRRLQIDDDASLAAVQSLELFRHRPQRIAFAGVLQLDHVRAEIGQEQGRVRAGV